MRKMRIFGILAIVAMVLASCQPQGATGPIIIGQQTSTITPSQAAARLNAAQLVNDIIEEADGITITEVEEITQQSAVIGSASVAKSTEETTTPVTVTITGYRLTVSFNGYDNGDCVITGGSLTINLMGKMENGLFDVTEFEIPEGTTSSLAVSSNRVYDYTMTVSSLKGNVAATIVIDGAGSDLSFSAGIVTTAPSSITGSIAVNGTTVEKSETTSSVESDSDWYTTVGEGENKTYSIDTLAELIRFGEIVSSGLDDFDGDTVNLAAGTYDFEGIAGFSVGNGTREDSKEGNDYVFNADANSFKGSFDGNNAVIRNWTFEAGKGYGSEDKNAYGFFAVIDGAEVKDLIFEDCHLTCGSSTGGIAVGFAKDSAISEIEVRDSSVVAFQGAGAIAGRLYSYNVATEDTETSSIKDCKVSGTAIITNGEYYDPTAGEATKEPPYNAGGIVGCVSGRAASNGANAVSGNTVDLRGENAYVKAAGEHAGGIAGTAAWTVFSGNTIILESEGAVGDIIAEGATMEEGNTGSKDVAFIHQYVSSSNSVTLGEGNHYRVGETETDISDTNNFIERDATEDGNA